MTPDVPPYAALIAQWRERLANLLYRQPTPGRRTTEHEAFRTMLQRAGVARIEGTCGAGARKYVIGIGTDGAFHSALSQFAEAARIVNQ